MQTYLNFLEHILKNGIDKSDRTGTGTRSVFAYQMRFPLDTHFPLVTTKKIHTKSVIHELLWFLQGNTNIQYLNQHGVRIWNEWANKEGELGPIYGAQWRSWPDQNREPIDQITQVIHSIKHNPDSRRHLVSAWNVSELNKMALPPCHILFQFYVCNGELSCQLYQRSADAFLGVPFNIASYSLLTAMIAQQCDLKAKEFIWTGGDCHIYHNHLEQVQEQLSRQPFTPPTLKILRRPNDIFHYTFEDFLFENYQCHPKIAAPIAI